MRKKQDTPRRKPRLKKESLRNLDLPDLSPDQLAQIAGGWRPPSCPCRTD